MCLMVRSNFAKKVGGWVGISERPLPFPTPMRYGKKTPKLFKALRGTKGHESELHQQSLIGFFKRLYIYVHVPSLSDEQSGRSPHVALSYPRPDQGQMIIQFGRALRQHFFCRSLNIWNWIRIITVSCHLKMYFIWIFFASYYKFCFPGLIHSVSKVKVHGQCTLSLSTLVKDQKQISVIYNRWFEVHLLLYQVEFWCLWFNKFDWNPRSSLK